MVITYHENDLTVEEYTGLRAGAGWPAIGVEQAGRALGGSLYALCAREGGQAVGMARLVGDGARNWYIQDVIVRPDRRGRGIGKKLMELLEAYIRHVTPPGDSVTVGLMCAKGREGFYEGLGFTVRPNEERGPGMEKYI